MGWILERQIYPPCVCPLNSKSNPEWAVAVGDMRPSLLDVIHPELMCIVDPSDEYLLVAALDLLALILKHADAHRFKAEEHPNGVVIQNASAMTCFAHAITPVPRLVHRLQQCAAVLVLRSGFPPSPDPHEVIKSELQLILIEPFRSPSEVAALQLADDQAGGNGAQGRWDWHPS